MERAGTVKEAVAPEEGSNRPFKYVITTAEGKDLKVTAWPDSGAANLEVGQSGVFIGESKQESYNGKTFNRFYADRFEARAAQPWPSPNGSTPQGSTGDSRDASFALSYAKDLCNHLIDVGVIKDSKDLQAAWGSLADFGREWLRQNA